MSSFINGAGVQLRASGAVNNWVSPIRVNQLNNGTNANDQMSGPDGNATLAGGLGDDTYIVWYGGNVVRELAGAGIDTAVSRVQSYRLTDNVENLSILRTDASGTGNALDNIITGSNGTQIINGNGGNDILIGGAGIDFFVFERGTGIDVINDFRPGEDQITIGGGFTQFTTFAAVQAAMQQVGADVRLTLGGGDAVLLRGVQVTSLTAKDFNLPSSSVTGLRQTFGAEFDTFTTSPTGIANGSAAWKTTMVWGNRALLDNNDKAFYSDSSVGVDPFKAANGVLDITAKPTAGLPSGLTYTSGMITTETLSTQTYGYYEMRADVALGKGFWSAFWLLRADGNWPSELDVMEILGDSSGTVHSTVHTNELGYHSRVSTPYESPVNTADGFNTYAVSWRPDFLTWYFNGTEVFSIVTPTDMHSPMHMIASLAVGGVGSWPGAVDGTSSSTLSIDYIRAYQFADLAGPIKPAVVRASIIQGDDRVEKLVGSIGNDRINSSTGNDTMTGAAGADTFFFFRGDGRDTITDFTPGTDRLLFYGINPSEVVTKTNQWGTEVTYSGIYGTDRVVLTGVTGLKPGDIVFGFIAPTGTSGADTLDWSTDGRALRLWGGAGNDTIRGGTGDDWVQGGTENDLLRGGAGADSFVFDNWDGDDRILDFTSGVDRIMLRNVDPATVWANPSRSTDGASSGLEINYGVGGNSIFLVNVTTIVAGDIIFS